jgi:hypothetical protein
MGHERRTIRRFLLWTPVRVEANGETVAGRIYDISGRGGFVWCERVWPVGTDLRLWLQPPVKDVTQELHARVLRLEEVDGFEGMAIVFTRVEESAAAFIAKLLDLQERPRRRRSGRRETKRSSSS